MKVLPITLLHSARFEHSPIKIHLKARIDEEASTLMVSTKMYGDSFNSQKTSKVNTFYKSSKTC